MHEGMLYVCLRQGLWMMIYSVVRLWVLVKMRLKDNSREILTHMNKEAFTRMFTAELYLIEKF